MSAENYTHIDLFTGIGGFSLSCHWNDIETVVMCENDKKCRDFLEQTWTGIPIIREVKDFDGTRWPDTFILTGGVPCQPASRAGKQGGKGDDRWLWPEAIRIVDEAKPRWCLFENPPGIYDVGIDGILSDLESIGYETGIIEIPACAVNSPQKRARVWIVAHSDEARTGGFSKKRHDISNSGIKEGMADTSTQRYPERGMQPRIPGEEGQRKQGQTIDMGSQGDMADTEKGAIRPGLRPEEPGEIGRGRSGDEHGGFWDTYLWTPCADGKLRRTPDDSFGLVDGLHRSILAALGNSIVPQVAFEIIKAIVRTENETP